MSDTEEKLKPCYECGEKPREIEQGGLWINRCDTPGCPPQVSCWPSRSVSREIWNKQNTRKG